MTPKGFLKLGSAAVLMGAMGTASAASISIAPNVFGNVGDVVSLDIVVDFSDVDTLGGGFDVAFNSSALAFVDFQSSYPGDPDFSRQPDVLDGLLEGFAFGDFNGLNSYFGVVGIMQFEILTRSRSTVIGQDTTSLAGPFIDANTFQPIRVEYQGAMVTSIALPVPAAAWLMFGALGALVGFRRQRG